MISGFFNKLFNRRITYKCVAYINDNIDKDKIVDAFEIKEFSLDKAYKTAYEVLKLKYPNMGLDIRIYTK
jgi:hypothetical protein